MSKKPLERVSLRLNSVSGRRYYTFLHPESTLFYLILAYIAIDFATLSLVLNRGSHYEQVHAFLTKRNTV